jgi:hypothetical protein
MRVEPKSVLDIGVGFGKWGFLCREYGDIWFNRYEKSEWTVRIDGCEAFPNYKTPIYDYIYDNIYYGDVSETLDTLPSYDLAILGDVIEHFDKETGLRLLKKLSQKCNYVLMSSPTSFFGQNSDLDQNPFEEHKCLWTIKDLAGYNFDYDEFEDYIFVALIDCKKSGLVTNRQRASSKLAYSITPFRRRPKLVALAKSVFNKLPIS